MISLQTPDAPRWPSAGEACCRRVRNGIDRERAVREMAPCYASRTRSLRRGNERGIGDVR